MSVPRNNFWSSIGNHDWDGQYGIEPYLKFFRVARYYDVNLDDYKMVRLYVLNSDNREPDGTKIDSNQAKWLENAVKQNKFKSCFNIVVFHHYPHSTRLNKEKFCDGCAPTENMDWDFKKMGIDAVFSGHAHWAERYHHNDMNYWVVGNTTDDLDFDKSERDHNSKFFETKPGYLIGEVGPGWLALGFKFLDENEIRDKVVLKKDCSITF
jgi:hypothetical protein